ncbi:hypothetical protein [Helicobacter himalayensis]|uniref:hypothetical protein n=1 Tax=Helicobacter himalayensis TaxID=1591088 RepID=UPI0008324DC0|nr:hypothetical protein [Helicobacter himalayensis]
MKILFINTNQIVQKLVEVTAQKANVELVSVSEAKQVGDMEQYDYIIADDDCYNLEKESFDALIKGRRACLIYSKSESMPSGFSEYIKKPFIPTNVLNIILQEIAKLQTKEHFNTSNQKEQEAQEQTPQEQAQEQESQSLQSQESSEPLSDLSALSKELNLETAESHEPSEDKEEKSEKIDTQDLLGDLDLEVLDDKELDELSSLQTPDLATSEKNEKEKKEIDLDSIDFSENERHEGSPMEDLDALLARVDGLDEAALDSEQSTQASTENTESDEINLEDLDLGLGDILEDNKDLDSEDLQGAISLDTQRGEENNLESSESGLAQEIAQPQETEQPQEIAQQENLDEENLSLEEADSAPTQSLQVLDSAQLSEVSNLLHEIESPSQPAELQDNTQSESADESQTSPQDENLQSLDLGLEDINLDGLEIPTDTLDDGKELEAHKFDDLELGEDLGMASLDDFKAELEDFEDSKESSDLAEFTESNEAFFTQDENQAQPTQTSQGNKNEINDEKISDDDKADNEGKKESLDEPNAQDSEIFEVDTTSLGDLDTAEIQSLENESLEVSDALPDELAPHLENAAQDEQSHTQNDDIADLDTQNAQEESQELIESAPKSTQDFQSLSENEVRQALGEAIDESAKDAQDFADVASAENIPDSKDSNDMQIDEITLPKEMQAHQNVLQELSDSLNKTISQSLQNIQSSETKELLNGLEVTINISFKDKHK